MLHKNSLNRNDFPSLHMLKDLIILTFPIIKVLSHMPIECLTLLKYLFKIPSKTISLCIVYNSYNEQLRMKVCPLPQ